jgi:hypothetical protein
MACARTEIGGGGSGDVAIGGISRFSGGTSVRIGLGLGGKQAEVRLEIEGGGGGGGEDPGTGGISRTG